MFDSLLTSYKASLHEVNPSAAGLFHIFHWVETIFTLFCYIIFGEIQDQLCIQ